MWWRAQFGPIRASPISCKHSVTSDHRAGPTRGDTAAPAYDSDEYLSSLHKQVEVLFLFDVADDTHGTKMNNTKTAPATASDG